MSRKFARTHAFKLIYQLNFTLENPDEIFDNYISRIKNFDEHEKIIVHDEFYGVYENLFYIDELISNNSKWSLSRLNKIDLSLIRLAIYEMLYEKNKPAIVINEVVDLANEYGTDASTGFVNGILAKISSDINAGVLNE